MNKENCNRANCAYDLVLFDCDGVLWRGDKMEPKADELVLALRARGVAVGFATNNSTMTKTSLLAKLSRCGIAANETEVASTATAAPGFLRRLLGEGKHTVFVMGMPALREELEADGFNALEPQELHGQALAAWQPPRVDAVLVGLDLGSTYSRISQCVQTVVTNPTVPFVASNRDRLFPMAGKLVPGAAAFVGAVAAAVGKEPLVIGKPGTGLAHGFIERWREAHGGAKPRVLVVGDNPETDIGFGKALEKEQVPVTLDKCDTCHITSGVPIVPKDPPTFSASNVAVLLERLEKGEFDC